MLTDDELRAIVTRHENHCSECCSPYEFCPEAAFEIAADVQREVLTRVGATTLTWTTGTSMTVQKACLCGFTNAVCPLHPRDHGAERT